MGHLFVGDRLLNESGMEKHPLTPMTDPDIRRWLSRQTRPRSAIFRSIQCERDRPTLALRLAERTGETLVVADAITDTDLLALGALAGHIGWSLAAPASPWDCRPISAFVLLMRAAGRLRPSVALPSSCRAVARRRRGGRSMSIATGIHRSGSTRRRARCGWRGETLPRFLERIAIRRR